MKPKTMILLVVAVGCGLVASVMTSRLIADRPDGPQEKMVKVLITKAKIAAYEVLKEPEKLFVEKEIPEAGAPKKAVHSFDELKDKRTTRALTEDTFITSEDLMNKDLGLLTQILPPGYRAVAFRVNPECLVGGFVLPGSRVDVLHTHRRGDKAVTRTILQNMLVVAVDMNSDRDPEKKAMLGNTVTMAVRPKEAQDLTLASQTGEIRLVLRSLGEDKQVSIQGSTEEDLARQKSTGGDTDPDNPETTPGNLSARVPMIPTLPPQEKKDPEKEPEAPVVEPVVKKHILTLIQGDQVNKVVFIKGVNSDDMPTPAPAPKKEPTPGKTSPAVTQPTPATPTPGTNPTPATRKPISAG